MGKEKKPRYEYYTTNAHLPHQGSKESTADMTSSASPSVGGSHCGVQAAFPSLSFSPWSCSCEPLSLTTRGQAAVGNRQDPAPTEATPPTLNPFNVPEDHSPFPQTMLGSHSSANQGGEGDRCSRSQSLVLLTVLKHWTEPEICMPCHLCLWFCSSFLNS